MVNVVNLNFLLAENDVHVPAGGVSLDFSRVYNSESQHDDLNDDNSTPSVYGNRWTNNLDVHIAWSPTQGNTGTISVYTADGARDDFTCDVSTTNICAVSTPGIYDLLAPTQLGGAGVACQFQLTKKSGVSYIFNAPYQGCSFGQGSYGRLQAIDARNLTFSIQLTYMWSPDDSNAENITRIIATHEPDGAQLTLNFSQVAGSSPPISELSSVERPDGQTLYYYYTTTGELVDVGKPGNNPILVSGESLPAKFADGNDIGTGNLPETYDIEHAGLLEVCGPRAAIAIINSSNNPADGACADFDYSSHQLSDWWTRGVLNPTPGDNIIASPIQTGESTGFVQWNDTQFFNNMTGEGCGYAATMTDALGHYVVWCYDADDRVTQTVVITNTTSGASVTTAKTWDSNNDVGSTTDARGFTTYFAYDPNGNVVEVSLPSQLTSKGTLRPTYLLDYDQYNNLVDFCDPTNNANNGWNPSQSDTLCESSGSSHYATYTYKPDANEPYGCLKNVSPPSAYSWNVTYGGGQCGNGQPTTVAAASPYPQDDGSNRQPTQIFSYYSNGMLDMYGDDNPHNTVWQYTYTSDKMNRIRSIADPDGVTSYRCYNQDGSIFYTETAQQNSLDDVNSCPTVAQLEGGIAPPPYATSYEYDPDGNTATALHHHGCGGGLGCTANNSSPNKCNRAPVLLGTSCYFYDGLDRLVEVRQPLSPGDLYSNPWITRYLYDLSGAQYTFHGNSLLAYGNLFETQELLPATPTVTVYGTPNPQPTSVSNTSYVALAAFAYDGADRLITKYAAIAGAGNNSTTTQTLTWDTSPLDSNLGGYLGKECNSASPPPQGQCQQFDYYPDGQEETFASNDGSVPQRNYTYDPDGRPTKIGAGYANPQTYTYDLDGNLKKASDAGGSDYATLTYNRYPDGSEESLDVSSQALSQKQLFDYSYRSDGPLHTYVIDDASFLKGSIKNPGQTTLTYAYTDAGRLLSRAESGAAANTGLPETQITYTSNPATGLIQSETTPVTNLSTFKYTAESELAEVTPNNPFCYYGAVSFVYSLRGELGGSTACPPQYSIGSNFANGVAVQSGSMPQSNSWTWNDLMAVLTGESLNGQASGWAYDGAGRMTNESAPIPFSTASPPPSVATTRTYDAENHLSQTTFASPSPNPSYKTVQWGPDGHPISIGSSYQGGSVKVERLHWSGGQLLFTTQNSGGQQTLDDVKVDVQGDILPGDTTGYSGLTFYDRGPGGTIMGCHNATGTTFEGLGDSWRGFPLGSCGSNKSPSGALMPDSILWGGSPYGDCCGKPLGEGGTLGMYRTDGFTDGFDTIQGVRSYDPALGSWTTPDSYAGNIFNPSSLKSYEWNANNPITNTDPTGMYSNYTVNQTPQWPEWGPDPTTTLWADYLNVLADNSGLLKYICGNQACGIAHGMPSQWGTTAGGGPSSGGLESNVSPHCVFDAYGGYVCQDANLQWAPLPNIMGAGQYTECGVDTFLLTIGAIPAVGPSVGGPLGRALGPANEYGGTALFGALAGFVQSYTGILCPR